MPAPSMPDYRVSQNRDIVVLAPQSLFATKEKIAEAALALRAANAMVTLVEDADGGRTPWKPFDGGVRDKTVYPVKVVWVSANVPAESHHANLSPENENSILYRSWADCHRTAQTVMGSSSVVGDNKEQPLVKQGADVAPIAPVSTGVATGGGASDSQANRGVYAIFEHAFPRFPQILADSGMDLVPHAKLISRINEIKTLKFDKAKMNKWWTTYKDFILTNPALENLFSKSFGLNDYVVPEIGDALSQVNSEVERQAETIKAQKLAIGEGLDENTPKEELPKVIQDQLRDLWNFHWAGVVMKDGEDYVTLENLSVENINDKNTNWYFKMYGPGQQSFHSEAKKDSHVGNSPISAGFRHVADAE